MTTPLKAMVTALSINPTRTRENTGDVPTGFPGGGTTVMLETRDLSVCCGPRTVPDGMVRRIDRDANPRDIRYSNTWARLDEPPSSCTDCKLACRARGRPNSGRLADWGHSRVRYGVGRTRHYDHGYRGELLGMRRNCQAYCRSSASLRAGQWLWPDQGLAPVVGR